MKTLIIRNSLKGRVVIYWVVGKQQELEKFLHEEQFIGFSYFFLL